jgi:hypothetical protein
MERLKFFFKKKELVHKVHQEHLHALNSKNSKIYNKSL